MTHRRDRSRVSASFGVVATAIVAMSPFPARADPCEAALPRLPGQVFTGIVRYVGDGDSPCVGPSSDPTEWIEVRLADFDAPELRSPEGPHSRAMLLHLASGRVTTCVAQRGRSGRVIVYDRVIAVCRIEGQSIGDHLRLAGAPMGGR